MYEIKNNKSNSVYTMVTSVIYITSMNKIRFWLQVVYLNLCGFFSKHNKNNLAAFWLTLNWATNSNTDFWSRKHDLPSCQLLHAFSFQPLLTILIQTKWGIPFIFDHLKFMRSTVRRDTAWERVSFFLLFCSPCKATLQDSQVLTSAQYNWCFWTAPWIGQDSSSCCFRMDFCRGKA